MHTLIVFTARCTLVLSAVLRSYIVHPSVRPSVTFRYRDHMGLNSSKIISRPNSVRPLLWLTPTWAIWCKWNTPKLGWNRGGVTQEHKKTCNISETVQDRTKVTITDFRLVPKSVTLNNLERRTQGLPKVFKYAQERVILRTSNLAGTFTGSIRTKLKRPLQILAKESVGVSRRCPTF